jgi:hypothetical protein
MLWWKDNKYKDITDNMKEWTTYKTGSNSNEVIMTNKEWKKLWTLKFTFEEAADKKRTLKPVWTVEKTTV